VIERASERGARRGERSEKRRRSREGREDGVRSEEESETIHKASDQQPAASQATQSQFEDGQRVQH